MSTTITAAIGGSTTPAWLEGYEAERRSKNIIHELIGGGIAVTLFTPRPRSGVLRLGYNSAAAAFAALALHEAETTFTVANDAVPGVGMTYVVGDAGLYIKVDETRKAWTVEVGFQEVSP